MRIIGTQSYYSYKRLFFSITETRMSKHYLLNGCQNCLVSSRRTVLMKSATVCGNIKNCYRSNYGNTTGTKVSLWPTRRRTSRWSSDCIHPSIFKYQYSEHVRFPVFCRRQSGVVTNPIHTADATKLDSFVASCRAV